jgi:PTS system mannose-specific IIC component
LKSVVNKTTDILYFMFGFVLAAAMGLTLLSATAIGGVFALINYQLTMAKKAAPAAAAADEEEDI